MARYQKHPVTHSIRQSPPLDLTHPINPTWLRNKHILITGGASGFGAAFACHWAAHGASLVIGDIDVQKGDQLCRSVRASSGNRDIHFVHCDVTDWDSQVALFKEAARLSPHGGIDAVVANAGVAGPDPLLRPGKLDAAQPPRPEFRTVEVNLMGVLYTTHLALFWLPRNPGSRACSVVSDPEASPRDRHLLLVGSVASLTPIVGQPLYGVSKHAVLGLFRSLRASSFVQGVRVNLLCPYFIDTPLLPTVARIVLAGGAMGKVEDVVDAATRFVADSRILGRAIVVGPKTKVKQRDNGEWEVIGGMEDGGEEKALWEAYADDFEDSELFTQRLVAILNAVTQARGWAGWLGDFFAAVKYGLTSLWTPK